MNEINVLTWNVSWEAMSDDTQGKGTVPGSINCSPQQCLNNVCNKIEEAIRTHNVSLIGTQETGKLSDNKLLDNNIHYIPDLGGSPYAMISYNNNYINITNSFFGSDFINGNFDLDNKKVPQGIRPYHFIILKEQKTNNEILFVNLHNDHDGNIQRNLNHINSKLNTHNFNYIIITGDFNNGNLLDGTLMLNGKHLNCYTIDEPTCCDGNLNGSEMYRGSFDNILTYGFDWIKTVKLLTFSQNKLHSDHLPVLVKLKFKEAIGFDFDGVLHKSIQDTDENGQRHPFWVSHEKLVKFEKIINKINTLKKTNIIKIISSRPGDTIVKFIKADLRLSDANIDVIAGKHNKVNSVIGKVIEFYDDSANHLISIMNAKIASSDPIKIFYVVPEFDDWYEVKSVQEIEEIFLQLQIYLLAEESYKINNKKTVDKTKYNTLKEIIKSKLLSK